MQSDWIIPLPPTAEAQAASGASKKAVGIYPCINNNHCEQFLVVKVSNNGRPYGTCSRQEISSKGCTREVKGLAVDVPEQTYAAYQTALKTVEELVAVPDTYKRHLEAEWNRYNEQEAKDANSSPQITA